MAQDRSSGASEDAVRIFGLLSNLFGNVKQSDIAIEALRVDGISKGVVVIKVPRRLLRELSLEARATIIEAMESHSSNYYVLVSDRVKVSSSTARKSAEAVTRGNKAGDYKSGRVTEPLKEDKLRFIIQDHLSDITTPSKVVYRGLRVNNDGSKQRVVRFLSRNCEEAITMDRLTAWAAAAQHLTRTPTAFLQVGLYADGE